MTLTITLPARLAQQLAHVATTQQLSVEEVVARIKALPPNPHNARPARGSLAEALRAAPENPDFDLAAWQQAWAAVEAEMKAITRTNDIAEGRR